MSGMTDEKSAALRRSSVTAQPVVERYGDRNDIASFLAMTEEHGFWNDRDGFFYKE